MEGFAWGKWVWMAEDGPNTYAEFQLDFDGTTAGKYLLRISVDGNYALHINDGLVSFGQYGDYEDLKFYDELDITAQVRPGQNRLNITVWHPGADSFTYCKALPGAIFEIERDGVCVAASSAQTQVRPDTHFAQGEAVERITPQLGAGFHYDAMQRPAPWTTAQEVRKPMPCGKRPAAKLNTGAPMQMTLLGRGSFVDTVQEGTPALRMHRAALRFAVPYRARKLPDAAGLCLQAAEGSDGVFVILDAGAEQTGHLRLEVEVAEACDVFIGWGEHLEDLRVRTEVGRRNFAVKYRAHPGKNVFENPLLRCGFRYLQVHLYTPECTLYYAGAVPVWYPQASILRFRCADAMHERIYDTAIRTLRMCMHEHYEDCPWREQSQYTMDSRNQMLCGYYAFADRAFPKAALRLMAHSIRPDNFLCICSPAGSTSMIPSFSAIFPVQLWEYLQFSGDTAFIREMLPTARRIAEEFLRRMDDDGVLSGIVDEQAWNFYEWQEGLQGRVPGKQPHHHEQDAVLCGFVLMMLRGMEEMCAAVGQHEEAARYEQSRVRLAATVHRVFFDTSARVYGSYRDDGVLHHYCELTNALLVYAGAVPEAHRAGVLARLAEGSLIPVTLSHSIYKYEALLTDLPRYGRQVFAEVAEKWGDMIAHGATTFWETADGAVAFNNAGSLCHGWSAVPVVLYMKYALQADPMQTGLYECRTEQMGDEYGR
ncbi:MAG: hypothetical protein IJY28_10005 [Clostridia bacterium]|nr:hypothetical protein [Clostridia bacterium]